MPFSIQLVKQKHINARDIVIVLYEQQLIITKSNPFGFYRFEEIEELVSHDHSLFLPVQIQAEEKVYVVELAGILDSHEQTSLRSQMHLLSYEQYQLASRALQLITWLKQHRYCGQCGQTTVADPNELALVCQRCVISYYPRISPCMMCLIVRGDECLLAHHHKHPDGMYSALAGFVEAGETLEQTLHREVMEEVGLQVDNLRYFGSQSWPFPHQLMIAYLADYKDGEIKIEDEEIADAQWFRYDQLPDIPPSTSIAGELIEAFVRSKS